MEMACRDGCYMQQGEPQASADSFRHTLQEVRGSALAVKKVNRDAWARAASRNRDTLRPHRT